MRGCIQLILSIVIHMYQRHLIWIPLENDYYIAQVCVTGGGGVTKREGAGLHVHVHCTTLTNQIWRRKMFFRRWTNLLLCSDSVYLEVKGQNKHQYLQEAIHSVLGVVLQFVSQLLLQSQQHVLWKPHPSWTHFVKLHRCSFEVTPERQPLPVFALLGSGFVDTLTVQIATLCVCVCV